MIFSTAPLPIFDVPADKAHHGGTYLKPKFIFLHHTGGSDSRKWLSVTSAPAVSCNRLISKHGVIFKIVPDNEQAWCQGFGVMGPYAPGSYTVHLPDGDMSAKAAANLNQVGLSIEIENMGDGKDPYPMLQLGAVADQIVEWWGRYGFIAILDHRDVDTRKNDPRNFPRETLDALIWQKLKKLAVGDV